MSLGVAPPRGSCAFGHQSKIGNHVLYHQGVVPKKCFFFCPKKMSSYETRGGGPLVPAPRVANQKLETMYVLYHHGVVPKDRFSLLKKTDFI